MSAADRATLARIAHRAAEAAAQTLRAHYDSPATLAVQTKADNTPVTAADLAAHDAIAAVFAEATPDIPLLSEENVTEVGSRLRRSERFWLVDPLDGTREFIGRTGEFSVNIALIESGEVTVGVLAVPIRAQLAVGWRDGGAWLHDTHGAPRRIRARRLADPTRPTITLSRFHHASDLDTLLARVPGHHPLVRGAGLKWVALADGEADLYPRLNTRMCEWDIAAGHLLLEEAGGRFRDGHGQAFRYAQREDWRVTAFLAQADRDYDWYTALQLGA
ncbi:MAG: 3'(2'),5'-bisphosphate nucleotidase CysQ [Xanthomonadales bacterium]|jgi:3'(2'), 5'-bisphosphate nucleotidase|nr:3'(2'),5'-bisphosphate nucleotidase CysQ [Xanthomonadales bacterium]